MLLPKGEHYKIKFARQNCEGKFWADSDCNKQDVNTVQYETVPVVFDID